MLPASNRFSNSNAASQTLCNEESLIADARCDERPAQTVERKLGSILKGSFAVVSDLRLRRLIAQR